MTTLLTALALGIGYGLVGVAVTGVALATRTLHLAVGPVLVVGVLTHLYLGVAGVPAPLALLAALLVAAAVSAALEPLVLRPLDASGNGGERSAPPVLRWLVGLAVAGAVVELGAARWLGTRQFRPDPLVGPSGSTSVLGVTVDSPVLVAAVLGAVLAAASAFAIARTGFGRRLRLVGASPQAAAISGVSPRLTRAGALATSGAAATLAGVLVAPITFVGVGQGALFTVRGVAAAVLLGVGGPWRAVAGGVLLGLVEAAGQSTAPQAGGEIAVTLAILVAAVWRGGELARAWGRAW